MTDEPTFNEATIFGDAVEMHHDDPPNAVQVNHYPGVRGIERLDMGETATMIQVKGVFYADTPEDLAIVIQTMRTLKQEATLGTLVDTDGTSWDNAVIDSMRITSRGVYAPGWGWTRSYEARIILLNSGDDEDA
jgi:hypothetical protein